ncbi:MULTISPECIES: chemotaxis protein CheA [unclassified Candidatus Frackibacter]|uniref:chemotaxis protein CheA n=1 Tax=unclassified Candidatus Frackibacter TaxID=2648818 RepID=UPI00079CCC0C|nr:MULTISPECIES: chemotaxis protein CheA [unclassified Candidatus Frackibacter]KXS43581.1 MAG: two-component system, chemotaxis family, sensor kinase CheA [Candidatus Frackibacter sp. T328-2]SDC62709.1 two-component system, chemotaxis family, sensor kinase CheA [Candidatus Frackibacter sp. WG11]SEM76447.1 two-component system, chemotaxis family, sensor kinase CheA [Candidatus Frackibacter sp. WG12]SFL86125.1 two-component system, chemotaxis family, sensor kinase CheA [Candidatus Frackibacter sp
MDIEEFQDLYATEAQEHLEILNNSLLQLEDNPHDLGLVKELFRAAHTLKGMAGTMGFEKVSNLTHAMENILDKLRNEEMAVSTEIVNLLFKSLDTLEILINDGEEALSFELEDIISELKGYASGEIEVSNDSNNIDEATTIHNFSIELSDGEIKSAKNKLTEGSVVFLLRVILEDDCVFGALRAKMVGDELESYGEIVKANPALQDIEGAEVDSEFQVLFISNFEDKEILDALDRISELKELDLEVIDDLNELKKAESKKNKNSSKKTSAKSLSKRLKSSSTIRVDVERLDDLMNLVAELVIKRTQVESIGESYQLDELNKKLKSLGKVTSELQNSVMNMRMVPINLVFNRFPRMVRDLAQEMEKEINLEIEGEDTELDRTIIDEIGDPLVHILRNAADHGIESPEERKKAGKDPAGTVKMSAFHEGNNVIIQIQDDGKGIDAEFIKQKALSKGVISQEEAEMLSDQETINLIFASGFSTSEEVSDVSGRGVGMDVVKNKIESLSGSVDIYSKVGEGSTFTIKLPLTLAIIQGFLINIADQKYVLPLETIQEIVKISPDDIKTIRQQEVIQRRGSVIPLISLRKELNKPEYEEIPEELSIVIIKIGEESYGLSVDSIIGQQEVVIKRINDLSDGVEKIAGATILGDGSVALIIDIEEVTLGK